jgi:uncharacterized RDD family membrane protein YckC
MTIQCRALAERVYSIETPENLVLYFERAGFASRALALDIDLLLMGALTQGSLWLLTSVGVVPESVASALWIVAGFLVQWGYGAICEWRFAGRTLGKRLTGLAVVDVSGLHLSFLQAVVRNLLRIIDLLPGFYLVGAVCCLLDPHGRRLGDLAARCIVVQTRRAQPPKEPAPGTKAPPSPWAATILAQLSGDERRALIALHGALETLSLPDRVGLCSALVEHFSQRHPPGFPAQLSPERVVSLLYGGLSIAGTARASSTRER